jgi:hypothetical protein
MGTGKGTAYRENSLEILSYSEWWEKNKTNKTYKNYTEE